MKEIYEKLIEERKIPGRTRGHRPVLVDLINYNNYQIVAEIGVAKGRTCKKILRSCPEIKIYWAIDHWKHYKSGDRFKHYSEDAWKMTYDGVCGLFQWFTNLRVLRLDSLRAAKLFPPGYFDIVFIDADHRYEHVRGDTIAWMPKVKKGGLLCGHDYPDNPRRRKYKGVVAAVNEIVGKEDLMLFPANVWAKEM